MTHDEFQHRYHDYKADTKEEALKEIEQMEEVEGHEIKAVHFPGLGWALMLDTAAQAIVDMGIIDKEGVS